jgi:hypothetical protein
VTITGTNFDPTPANNQVTIGGVAAPVQSASTTQLVVSVPAAAVSGLITVATAGGTAQSTSAFTVIAMTALTITPTIATLPTGSSYPFRATATFADETTSDVTGLLAWTSNNAASVTIGTTGVAQGVTVERRKGVGSLFLTCFRGSAITAHAAPPASGHRGPGLPRAESPGGPPPAVRSLRRLCRV